MRISFQHVKTAKTNAHTSQILELKIRWGKPNLSLDSDFFIFLLHSNFLLCWNLIDSKCCCWLLSQFLPAPKPQSENLPQRRLFKMSLTATATVKRKIFTESIMKMCHRHTNLIFNLFTSPHRPPARFPSHFPRWWHQQPPPCMLARIQTTRTLSSFIIRAQDVAEAALSNRLLLPELFSCVVADVTRTSPSVCYSAAVSCAGTIKGEEITLMLSPWQC